MARPTIYFDECVTHDVIPFLLARGTAIETAQAHDRAQQQIPDDGQLQFATAHGWVILTTNAEHFRKAHQRFARAGHSHAGIITLPQEGLHQPRFFLRCAMLIDWLEQAHPDPRNRLLRWTDLQRHLNSGESVVRGYDERQISYACGQIMTPPDTLLVAMQQSEDASRDR